MYRTCTNECDQNTLLILHKKSLVSSQLEYEPQVWSPYTKECVQSVTKLILKCDLHVTYPE